jgi:hypothetical protein
MDSIHGRNETRGLRTHDEVPVARVNAAGRLRAEAAALRDAGGEAADWEKVSAQLDRSYQSLYEALQDR